MKNDISKYPDLVKYRRRGIIIPIVFTAIYELLFVALIVALFICNMFMYNTVFYLILAVVAIIPLFVFKPFDFLFDTDYKGKIKKTEYKEELGSTSKIANVRRVFFFKECTDICIVTDDEKEIVFSIIPDDSKMKEFTPNPGYGPFKNHLKEPLIDYYKIGDEVEHYSGFSFNRKLNLKPNDKNICIVCGTLNSQKENTCKNCGHSIVK